MKTFTVAATAAMMMFGALGSQAAFASSQPHMDAALQALETAKTELAAASADKGGYRQKALKNIEEASNQVKKGIEAGSPDEPKPAQ